MSAAPGRKTPTRSTNYGVLRKGLILPAETRNTAWSASHHHEGQAARLSGALGALVAHHRAEAEKYRALTEGEPRMTEGHEHSTRLSTWGLPYGTQAADEMLDALAEPSGADA